MTIEVSWSEEAPLHYPNLVKETRSIPENWDFTDGLGGPTYVSVAAATTPSMQLLSLYSSNATLQASTILGSESSVQTSPPACFMLHSERERCNWRPTHVEHRTGTGRARRSLTKKSRTAPEELWSCAQGSVSSPCIPCACPDGIGKVLEPSRQYSSAT